MLPISVPSTPGALPGAGDTAVTKREGNSLTWLRLLWDPKSSAGPGIVAWKSSASAYNLKGPQQHLPTCHGVLAF